MAMTMFRLQPWFHVARTGYSIAGMLCIFSLPPQTDTDGANGWWEERRGGSHMFGVLFVMC